MTRWRELLITVAVVGLVAWAVGTQILPAGEDDALAPPRVLEVGEALSPDLALLDLDGRFVRLGDRLGGKATVLYSWSTTCPCIPVCDRDLVPLLARFGEDLRWIAIGGEKADDPARVRATLAELDAPYDLLRDPTHRLCGPLGLDRAALVVVLDGDGYVRFRGNPTDDLAEPEVHHLESVLPAVVAGRRPPVAELEPVYGCAFSDPLPDCPDAELAAALEVSSP